MRLLVDVGNTNVKLGLADGDRLLATHRLPTRGPGTVDMVEDAIARAVAGRSASLETVESLAVASVVPAWTRLLLDLAERRRLPIFVAGASTLPIEIRSREPGAVGIDRLLNALAARSLYGQPAVAVDLGTATTFDVVDEDGAFAGGAIAPGLRLGLEALARGTAQLPLVEPELPASPIGTDTVAAIRSGGVLGHVGLVTYLVTRIREELLRDRPSARLWVVVTGGLATDWWADVPGIDAVDRDLTLRGLALAQPQPAVAER